MRWDYRLVESVLVFTGTRTFLRYEGPQVLDDPSANGQAEDFDAARAAVRLGQRGDAGAGERTIELSDRKDLDFSLGLTEDRRLSSLTFKSTGVGALVVAAGAKLLGTVIGIGARAALAGRGAAPEPTAARLRAHAEQAWSQEAEGLVTRRAQCVTLVESLTEQQLAQWQLGNGSQGGDPEPLLRSRRLARLLAEVRSEIGRIDALKAARLAGWLPENSVSESYELSTAHAYRAEGELPADGPGGRAQEVWDALGLAVQIGAAGDSVEVSPVQFSSSSSSSSSSDEDYREPEVRWRIPRRVQVTLWRRSAEGPVAESRDLQWIVDEKCDTVALPLRERTWGSSSAEVTFGPLGAPTLLTTGSTSAAGAIADALGGVPADLVAGLASATSLSTGVTGLLDAAAERQLAGVKRRVELQQQLLAAKGAAATEADLVRLKVLQQRVEIAEAEGKLLPLDELAVTKQEVDLLTARQRLEKLLEAVD